jgi:hypothetical protein
MPETWPLRWYVSSYSKLVDCYLYGVLDGVGHDEFLDGQFVDESFELFVGAESMEAVAVDVACSFFLEFDGLLADGAAGADHVGEQYHISIAHVLTEVDLIVVEADAAVEVEEAEGVGQLRNCLRVQSVRACADDDWVFDVGVDEVGCDQFGCFYVEEVGVLGESFGRAHEAVEGDDFVAAHGLQ